MELRLRVLRLLVVVVFATACSSPPAVSYPDAYRAAVGEIAGISPISDEHIDRFIAFFAAVSEDGVLQRAAELYAERLYFSDSLMHTRARDDVLAHFASMRDAGMRIAVTEHGRVVDGQNAYVIWSMTARFRPLSGEVESDTIGVTHLRFDDSGRIVLQQDFWDTGLGLYAHVPVLGHAIDGIAARFRP